MVLMTSGVFANEIAEKNEVVLEKSKRAADQASTMCCAAYLTYNGVIVDQETSCAIPYTTQGNCGLAETTLLNRNPVAKKAIVGI